MLKKENINKYENEVSLAVGELWNKAFMNQKNENDLVLILANGIKNNYPEETLKKLKNTNYQIGHDFVHFKYSTFFNFFNQYKFVINEKDYEVIEDKQLYDDVMVQMQLLSYMKFWEADLILKRLYNLSRLSQGKEYAWEIPKEKLNNRRILVKDEIQNPLQELCPKFYSFIEDIYSRQLRNAIAHSQYYIMFDTISLTNKSENKHYKLNSISFERWDEIFTKVILLHNYMIDRFNRYHHFYAKEAEDKHNGLRVYFPEKDKNGFYKSGWLKFDRDLNKWNWNRKTKS